MMGGKKKFGTQHKKRTLGDEPGPGKKSPVSGALGKIRPETQRENAKPQSKKENLRRKS